MNIEQAKQELVKRYKYLYENAYFILAPYMYEQSNEEFEITVVENIKKYNVLSTGSIVAVVNLLIGSVVHSQKDVYKIPPYEKVEK